MNHKQTNSQTTIRGNVNEPALPGRFEGPVAVGQDTEAVDARGSRNFLYKPTIYQGQAYPRLNHRAEIADLLRFYTGTFVGREDVLNELMTLDAMHKPGYHLVEAPPGHGKTALLVQLLCRHEQDDWPDPRPMLLTFFVREEGTRNTATDFLAALNSQLLAKLGMPGGIPNELNLLRAQLTDLWSRVVQASSAERPLLLLVDGLDEMSPTEPTIAQLLPGLLGPHVHIVVTSRPNPAALEQVSIEHPFREARTLTLRSFGPAEVRALLTEHSDPVPRTGEFVERLLRLTNGEPLFLRFLCQQVAEWGECAEAELTALPELEGVEDYFRQQLGHLHARAKGELAYDVLDLLLVARGGVTVDELADVLGQRKVTMIEAIQPIRRFLLGESRLELMHPEFRRAVATLFKPRECQKYEDRLLRYARAMWQEDSQYALSHLSQHLYERGEVDELLGLIEDSKWQRARRRDDLASSGLARDVDYACRATEADGIHALAQYTAASLLRARLRSMVTNLPVEAIEALARLGRFDQARALADIVYSEGPRVSALWRLGQRCLDKGDTTIALDLLERARVGILRLEKDKNRSYWLARLASHFYQAGQADEAEQILDTAFELLSASESEVERGTAVVALVGGMYDYEPAVLASCLDEAEGKARQIERIDTYRALALARIAEQFHRIDGNKAQILVQEAISILSSAPASYGGEGVSGVVFSQRDAFLAVTVGIAVRVGLENQGLKLVLSTDESAARAAAYAEIGKTLVDHGRDGEAESYLQQALALAETVLEGVNLDSFKRRVISLLLEVWQVSEVQKLAESIQDQTERVNAFCAVAEHLSKDGGVEDACNWLERMDVDWGRAFGRAAIGTVLIESHPESAVDKVSEGLQLARQIREGIVGTKHQAYALLAACVRDLADVKPRRAKELLHQIVEDLQSAVGRHTIEIRGIAQARDETMVRIAEVLASTGYRLQAVAISEGITNDHLRDGTLLSCIRAACAESDWDAADSFLSRMSSDCWRLVGELVTRAWRVRGQQPREEILDGLDERLSEACKGFFPVGDAFGYAATELGIAGHMSAARALWDKMGDRIARYESQAESVRLLSEARRIEEAEQLTTEIEHASHKARAKAYIAKYYSVQDLATAQALVNQAWNLINPYDIPVEHWNRSWHADAALVALAGAVARWDLSEADQIAQEWIEKEDNRREAEGRVATAILTVDPQRAYKRLKGIIATGASSGLVGFWQSLAACSEGLTKLLRAENVMRLHQHILLIEKSAAAALTHQ